MSEWLQHISRAAEGRATRSTALQPLLWLTAILLTALGGLGYAGASQIVVNIVSILLCVVVGILVFSYVVFAFRDPDALRSEKFVIRKMEIEQSSIGDSDRGLTEARPRRPRLATTPKQTGGADA